MSGLDANREARAWATARNVPTGVMSEAEFLHGGQDFSQFHDALRANVEEFVKVTAVPGLAEHTEAAVRRIAHNSIVVLALREAFEDVFNHPDHPNAVNVAALPELRRAWRAWKDTL